MERIIAGKTALDENQILDRYTKGCKYLELHTTIDNIENDIAFEKIKELGMEVISIHSPFLDENKLEYGLGNYEKQSKYFDAYKKTIDVATKYIKSKRKIVVIHLCDIYVNSSKKQLLNELKEQLINLSDYANERDSGIILVLENHMKYLNPEDKGLINFGAEDEAVLIVKNIGRKNVKVMLDICHALSAVKFGCKYKNISQFFEAYKDYLEHIHLANGKNDYLKENHGTSFENSDIELLSDIYENIEKLKKEICIVIETSEKDINNAVAYSATYEVLEKIIKNKQYSI